MSPFESGEYENIRTLFPMPFITIHMVVREDSDIMTVADLAGRTFISGGTGTFCQRQVASIFETLGIEGDIATMAVPVGACATNMDDETALAIVTAFWEQREGMAGTNPWWAGVSPDLVPQLGAPLHEGVVAFYAERGVAMS